MAVVTADGVCVWRSSVAVESLTDFEKGVGDCGAIEQIGGKEVATGERLRDARLTNDDSFSFLLHYTQRKGGVPATTVVPATWPPRQKSVNRSPFPMHSGPKKRRLFVVPWRPDFPNVVPVTIVFVNLAGYHLFVTATQESSQPSNHQTPLPALKDQRKPPCTNPTQ